VRQARHWAGGTYVKLHQAFRFELDPCDRARSALASHAGAARFAYNWGLVMVTG
jgi:putative transposase